ncbi:MAG: hypothetical protein Q7J34_08740 [Bacteroidales bacterium]|nr:hypothetical protein [Bacteroidales bacterium]
MTKRFFLAISLFSILLSACETNFDVNADWKDTPVVYSIISQSERSQVFRINRAYLGSGDALMFAQIADSINYDTTLIRAHIEDWRNGYYFKSIKLVPEWIHRDSIYSSVFYNPDFPYVLIYKTEPYPFFKVNSPGDTLWLNPDAEYKLIINNLKNGKEITSSTPLVKDFTISKPLYNPYNPQITIRNNEYSNSIKWRAAENGKRYECMFRFYYKEWDTPGDSTLHVINWSLGSYKSKDAIGGYEMETVYSGRDFYTFLKNNIPANSNVKRGAHRLELVFTVVADEFNTYIEVNEPSSSIIQERPEYTNINNGLGLFSSRLTKKRMYRIGSDMEADIISYFGSIDNSFKKISP